MLSSSANAPTATSATAMKAGPTHVWSTSAWLRKRKPEPPVEVSGKPIEDIETGVKSELVVEAEAFVKAGISVEAEIIPEAEPIEPVKPIKPIIDSGRINPRHIVRLIVPRTHLRL